MQRMDPARRSAIVVSRVPVSFKLPGRSTTAKPWSLSSTVPVGRITGKRGGQSGVRTVPYALAPGYRRSGPRKGSHYTRRPSTQLPYIPPPAARSVQKTGQKTMKTLENRTDFWYNMNDPPCPSEGRDLGPSVSVVDGDRGHRCHAREGMKVGGFQYSSSFL